VNGAGAHRAEVRKPVARKGVHPVKRAPAPAPAPAPPKSGGGATVHASLLAEFTAQKPGDEFKDF
jgi:hypothetical protein